MCQVNSSVIFSGKAIGPEEFLNQMIEALGIIIDRRPKGKLRKIESQIIKKEMSLFSVKTPANLNKDTLFGKEI